MKRLQREFTFTTEQQSEVRALARAFRITETTAGILYSRGMNTEEKAERFLNPSCERLLSPFCMKGMREAVELITTARDEGWSVAVFGDYDADGIGACAILSRALRAFGIEPYVYVPERTQGYGMNIKAIDDIFDECMPDLFITVDCGISNRKEVEYIKEQGAYAIVTDHHELPEQLPDCIIINPKLKDDYPYDNLCGAGVAFKLAAALIGDRAMELIDFAALSTVADSVPLTHENRDIVAEGLKRIEKNPRPAFAALLGKTSEVTAQTLSFSIAPRINAAGRMGDAKAALRLFTSDDGDEIEALAQRLNAYNADRQQACDALYAQAVRTVRQEGAYGNVVMIAGENWNAGFVGIVAARIAEEFSRPALLFVKHGSMMRGSARSIENVNIFEALKACGEHIEEFGGHAQAAGINVRAENFEKLRHALDEYIGTHYAREDFIPTLTVVGAGDGGERLARELARLEPFGIGNPRPLFTAQAKRLSAAPVKALSPHVTFNSGNFPYMYFNGAKDLRLLRDDLDKTLVYEFNLSKFRGREYLKGFVRAVLYEGVSGGDVELDAFENALRALKGQPRGQKAELLDREQTERLLIEKWNACRYGLCAVVHEKAALTRYRLPECRTETFRLSAGNLENAVLYAPEPDVDLSAFREVVFLDMPAAFTYDTGSARVYACEEAGYKDLLSLETTRDFLLGIFAAIRGNEGLLVGESGDLAAVTRACNALGYAPKQFLFALAVFEELGLIAFENGGAHVVRGKKASLSDSLIYDRTVKLQDGEPTL